MRLLRPGSLATVLGAAAGVACLALATPAWAEAGGHQPNVPSHASGGDPKGANGTVKIDDVPVDDSVRNDPHVSCNFAVKFFGFDKDQHANIIFTAHPPTGSGEELLRRDNVLVSTDAAGGAANDADKVFTFSANDLGLSAYTPQPKQGYHVKLTVEIIGAPGAGKHKVFWVQPCVASQASPPPSNGGGNNGGGNNGGGNNGGGSGGGTTPSAKPSQPAAHPSSSAPTAVRLTSGSLPVTGSTVASVIGLGLLLVAAGIAVLAVRRRALKFRA